MQFRLHQNHAVADSALPGLQHRPFTDETPQPEHSITSPSTINLQPRLEKAPSIGCSFGQIPILSPKTAIQTRLTVGAPDDQYE
jgi:hypothetical protein